MRYIILLISFMLIGPLLAEEADPIEVLGLQEPEMKFQPGQALPSDYYFSSDVNPFYLRGDFNGDSKMDVVALVQDRDQRRFGLAFFHKGEKKPIIIGAGSEFGNGGLDFVWMNLWHVSQIKKIPGKSKKDDPIKLKGEAILIQKFGSGGAYIYWDGKSYQWHQHGD